MAAKQVWTYRNGETEPPTIVGEFWFVGKLHHRDYFHDIKGLVEITEHYLSHELLYDGEECYHRMGDFEGQWYGPNVAPWEPIDAAPGVPAIPAEVARVIRKGLERYKNRIMEVGMMGWYSSATVTTDEIIRIDAALSWLGSIAERGEG